MHTEKPSLVNRIIIGKLLGLAFGAIGFVTLPYIYPEASAMLRWGILFWYVTFGAVIAIFGVFTFHPVLNVPLPWWFRSTALGAWLNFVLCLFAYEDMQALIVSLFGQNGLISSPFWFAAEGAILGLIIGYFATRYGGEGVETVGR